MYFLFCITLIRLNDLVVKFAYYVSPSLGIQGDPFHIKLRSYKYMLEVSDIRRMLFFYQFFHLYYSITPVHTLTDLSY